MTLSLDIQKNAGKDTQVKCIVDDKRINESYSFGELNEDLTVRTDEQIDSYIRTDLTAKGYLIK